MAAPTHEITSVLQKLPARLPRLGERLAGVAGAAGGRRGRADGRTTDRLGRCGDWPDAARPAAGPAGAQIVRGLAGPASLALLTLGLAMGCDQSLDEPRRARLCLETPAVPLSHRRLLVRLQFGGRHRSGDAAFARRRSGLESPDRAVRLPLAPFAARWSWLRSTSLESVFDQDISTWLTGLGIAGLAVSLAAQDSLKQFFGSIAILLDHSFRIGDEVISCGYDGTIEDIGFRSTKIRTADGHLVTIPNANLANNPIENVSRRPAARRIVTLLVAGQTPWENSAMCCGPWRRSSTQEDIRGPVRPVIDSVAYPPQVRFEDIQGGDFRLTVTYWYAPATDPDYAAHAERVNLQIVAELQKAGVELVQAMNRHTGMVAGRLCLGITSWPLWCPLC